MIKGSKFRGISYKCGVSHFNEQLWAKAIKEFESIPLYREDGQVCEMLGRCYDRLGDTKKAKEMFEIANILDKKESNEKEV